MVEGRFLAFILAVGIALGLLGPYGEKLLLRMASTAVEAKQHDQMSYGKFSRQLWQNNKLRY